jgi:hypothetical protein
MLAMAPSDPFGVRRAGCALLLLAAPFAGLGWLYLLRDVGWFGFGPAVPDSLPLLQLAGFSAQPLARVVVAWFCTGALVGAGLVRLPRWQRVALAAAAAVIVLLLASEVSFAVARNIPFRAVLGQRAPGLGPWLEAAALAVGTALPAGLAARRRPFSGRLAGRFWVPS